MTLSKPHIAALWLVILAGIGWTVYASLGAQWASEALAARIDMTNAAITDNKNEIDAHGASIAALRQADDALAAMIQEALNR